MGIVRALMKCTAVDTEGNIVRFDCSYDSELEEVMRTYSKYTPWGNMEMNITVPETLAKFVVGKQYYLDFTPVEEAD